jgi:hypothetical protein
MIGELLEAIREAQAMGEIATRLEALDFAREHMKPGEGAVPSESKGGA